MGAIGPAITRAFAAGEAGRRGQASAAALLLNLSTTPLWTSLLQSALHP